jgi:hypothetical protein
MMTGVLLFLLGVLGNAVFSAYETAFVWEQCHPCALPGREGERCLGAAAPAATWTARIA